jgi:glucose/mannose-6-phosphate isomerase
MLKVIEEFPMQCREALELPRGETVSGEFANIVITGMGGSAIGGDLLKSCLHKVKIPVFVNRDYQMPAFVDEKTLVFAVSYSGNTEETISAVKDAIERKAKVIGITSGGKLAGMCEKIIKVPAGYQPRAALGYLFFPMLGILHNSGIVNVKNAELNEMLNILKKKEWFEEEGEKLAKKLNGKIPIIYASELLMPSAMRFKTQINENAKLPAYFNVFSEMNHNEINAFRGMDRKFSAILIKDIHDNERIQKRMKICQEVMEERVDVEVIDTQGEWLLSRLFSAIYLGDFTSYYLAILNRVDPSPVEVIERLKQALKE